MKKYFILEKRNRRSLLNLKKKEAKETTTVSSSSTTANWHLEGRQRKICGNLAAGRIEDQTKKLPGKLRMAASACMTSVTSEIRASSLIFFNHTPHGKRLKKHAV